MSFVKIRISVIFRTFRGECLHILGVECVIAHGVNEEFSNITYFCHYLIIAEELITLSGEDRVFLK